MPSGEFAAGWAAPGFGRQTTRKIRLDGFWIAKNDVTVSQFFDYCAASGYKFDWDGRRPDWFWEADDRPMVAVTSEEARAYCKWAGGDLPTEAQWEKAARGTDGRLFPWGNDWQINSCSCSQDGGEKTEPAPIGSFPKGASPYGCLADPITAQIHVSRRIFVDPRITHPE